jgi:hypothetical protein
LLSDELGANGTALADAYRGLGHGASSALDAAGAIDLRTVATLAAVLCVLSWPLLVRWLAR